MKFDFVKIEEIFDIKDYEYFAHHKKVEEIKVNEKLQDHISLCEEYLKKIIEEKKLSKIIEKILMSLELESNRKEFYYKLIANVISFHDFGKINPEYQKQKMKNKNFYNFPINIEGLKGADHSLFSSAIYISYFLEQIEINNLKSDNLKIKKETYLAIELIFNFAYLISKHHSNLLNFEEFLNNNDLKNIIENLKDINILREKERFIDRKKFNTLITYYRSKRTENFNNLDMKEVFSFYILNRLVFSLLVAADYYATSEFMKDTKIIFFGNIEDILEFKNTFEENNIIKNIRNNKENYLKKKKYEEFNGINEYRSKIFIEAEEILEKNINKNIFFLEAPTGGGKSNTALNLSFKLIDDIRRKIFYIYPFNTLVEQNKETLETLFSNENILNQIKVVNSITPITDTGNKKNTEEEYTAQETYIDYDKILLDRQFLNYPLIIMTHVGIFDILIGNSKENMMAFHQLANSVIVFDEIQAYNSKIWTEIMMVLENYAEILNIKIIIMSATLPDLSLLTGNNEVVRLMKDRDFYFKAPIFKDRVSINFDLLKINEIELENILEHIIKNSLDSNKILVEFISKKEAKNFYRICKENEMILKKILKEDILLLTGENNKAERKEVISKIKESENKVLLIATQLIEAGVDIDMDVGYKDISAIDNEEQFLGRVNRSCKKNGKAYFFNLKDAKKIYKDNISIVNDLNLNNLAMRDCLVRKDFSPYFEAEMNIIKSKNRNFSKDGLEEFRKSLWNKNFEDIKNRLRLIKDEGRKIQYFFNRILNINNEIISGSNIWQNYKEVLEEVDYAKQKVLLSQIREKMSYFIYEVYFDPKRNILDFNDRIGELFYIEDGDKYFEDGILNFDEKEELFI